MADFSTRATDIETTIAPAATLVQPITGEGQISALNQIGKGVEQAAKVFQTVRVNSANLEANKFRADFSIKLNNLQDAHDQGTITDAEFRTRSRALLSQSLANGPAQTDDLLGDYSKFQNQSGLDKIAAPGVQRAELKQAQVKAAVDNGFITVADVGNLEKEAQAIAKLDKFNSSLRDLKEQTDAIALESSKLELGSKQRIDKQAQLQEVTTNGLAKVGRDALPYWQTQYENIKIKASQATSEQERRAIIEEGVRRLDTDYAQRAASISGDTLGVDQARIDQIFKPQRNLLDTYIKELNGEYSTESYERFTKNAQAQATMMAMEGLDDQTRQWIAVSELAKSAGAVFQSQVAGGVIKAFEQNARAAKEPKQGVGINQLEVGDRAKPYDPLPSSSDEKKSTQDYLNGVTQIIEDRTAGKFDQLTEPEKKNLDKEIQDQLNSIFRGVDVYSNSSEGAKEFQPIIDFLANPTIGDYLQGGKVPKEVQGKIAQVLQSGYSSQVIPMLQRELGDSRFNQVQIDGQPVDINTMVDPTMESGRFGFKLKPAYQDSFVAKASLRKLNESSFSKVLNKMIISDAHIRGDNDYNKSFEETFKPSLFPDADGDGSSDKVDSQTTGSVDQGVDFDLTSLVQTAEADPAFAGSDAETLKGELSGIAKAIDIGETGSGDYGTLLGHTNKVGRKFDDADITNKTVDDLIAFSSPGGAYADYSKKQVGRVATPMGRYQIVGRTLRKLKNELGLTGEEQFTPELQDRLFLQLLKGRGYERYKNGEITKAQFTSNLQSEWEGLEKSKKSFNALVASL